LPLQSSVPIASADDGGDMVFVNGMFALGYYQKASLCATDALQLSVLMTLMMMLVK
jgi:hypothetical protein